MKAPWLPPKGDNYKGKQVEFVGEDPALLAEAERLIRRDSVQQIFNGYHYDNSKRLEDQALSSKRRLSLIESAKQKALE